MTIRSTAGTKRVDSCSVAIKPPSGPTALEQSFTKGNGPESGRPWPHSILSGGRWIVFPSEIKSGSVLGSWVLRQELNEVLRSKVSAVASATGAPLRHAGAAGVRGAHLGQDLIQPLQRAVQVQLDPAGRAGDRLAPKDEKGGVTAVPVEKMQRWACLDQGHPYGFHPYDFCQVAAHLY